MNVTCSIIDWTDAKRRLAAGTLSDDLEEVEGGEDWIQPAGDEDSWSDSGYLMTLVNLAYQAMAPHLEEKNRSHAEASIGFVLAPGKRAVDDLGLKVEEYYLTLAPERVAQIARDFEQIDFAPFAELHEKYGRAAADDEYLEDYDHVQEYFDQWKAVFVQAARDARGIVCFAA